METIFDLPVPLPDVPAGGLCDKECAADLRQVSDEQFQQDQLITFDGQS